MPAPLRVFGRETASVVFAASGPMAVLDGVSAPDLARELGIAPELAPPDKFLGEKVLVESSEEADGMTFPRASRSMSQPLIHIPARCSPAAPTRST
ncbi:hypothetical protein [Mesorhizobium sp. M0590]|uniref:hypothetical protein n=1 Tax=Mesorhizobium sp. M0590 TaxID=2956966 RepID=UPI00333C9748